MSEKFRVIIAAVRDFSNYELLRNKCDEFLHDKVDRGIVVFCGTDKGSFSLGKRYAQEKGYMIEVFSADWKKYGNRAGYIRDFQMVNSAHALIAFWDGESKEGKRKIDFARRIGIEVYVPHYEYLNFGSSLEKYLSDVSSEPLLSREEEVELVQNICQGGYEGQRAKDKLVKAYRRFVIVIAKQYQHQGLSLIDLIDEGNIGLMKAVEKFDERCGFKLTRYVFWWIRQRILHAIDEQSRVHRIPISLVGRMRHPK